MKFTRKTNKKDEELVNAILGAAVLAAAAEQAEPVEPDMDKDLKRALELKAVYDRFVEVGFTEEQATAFITAILS